MSEAAKPEEPTHILLRIKVGEKQTFCIASFIREEDGRAYAKPSQETAFAHFGKITLDARRLELCPNSGGGIPIYLYHELVESPPSARQPPP